jgi:hypothetical protein
MSNLLFSLVGIKPSCRLEISQGGVADIIRINASPFAFTKGTLDILV